MSNSEKQIDLILKNNQKRLVEEMEVYSYDDDDYVARRKRIAERKRKQKKRNRIKVAVLICEFLAIAALVFSLVMLVMPNSKAWLMNTWLGKQVLRTMFEQEAYENIHDTDFDRNDTGINDDINSQVLDEYMNIALFGLDARKGELESGVQSDCIIIVSINKKTKELRMCSIYRDSYLRCYDGDGNVYFGKVNSAYSYGGAKAAVKTLNTDLDLNIQDYVSINFDGIAEVIDKMGGLDLVITSDEAYWINKYVSDYMKESGRTDLIAENMLNQVSGEVHLNGIQATAYSRIRYTTFYLPDGSHLNDDFGRTARQRYVINRMLDRAKFLGLENVMDMAEEIFKSENQVFLTSLPYETVLELIPLVLEISMDNSMGFPQKYVDYSDAYYGDALMPVTLTSMVQSIHEFLFDVDNYKVSGTVEGINNSLCSLIGIDPDGADSIQ